MSDPLVPLGVFRFHVDFFDQPLGGGEESPNAVARGAFAECTGLEATVEPRVIPEGGLNDGAHQRVGRVSYGTVVLRRGLSTDAGMWQWFELVRGGAYAHRMACVLTIFDVAGSGRVSWRLERCLPVKFKAADLLAGSPEVGIEELHLVHEGLQRVPVAVDSLQPSEAAP